MYKLGDEIYAYGNVCVITLIEKNYFEYKVVRKFDPKLDFLGMQIKGRDF